MNEDAEKLKTKVQEFLKTLPKEKLKLYPNIFNKTF